MRCSTKSSGMATVAMLFVLLAAPGEIAVPPASAAAASQSIPFVPSDDPAPDCATGAGNPACPPESAEAPAWISRRRRSAARAVQHATHGEVS